MREVLRMVSFAGCFGLAGFGFYMSMPAWMDVETLKEVLWIVQEEEYDSSSFWLWISLVPAAIYMAYVIVRPLPARFRGE